MADIFISYAQEDGERIQPLVALLESQGWSVFWDRKLLPGDNWTTEIDQKLKGAKAAIVVWSRHSTTSEWVKAEAMAARERAILVPVRIDQSAIPLPFGLVQTADISPEAANSADSLGKLVTQISGLLAKAPANPEIVANFASTQKSIFSRIDWMQVMFDIEGRLSRKTLWLSLIVLMPVLFLAQFAIENVIRATHTGGDEATIMSKSALAYTFLTLYPTIALTTKRLHDFNWSGWWGALPIAFLAFTTSYQAELLADPKNLENVASGLWLALANIVPFALIGLIPGTRGPNRFGMPPP